MQLRRKQVQKQKLSTSLNIEARQGIEFLSMTAAEIREYLACVSSNNIFLDDAGATSDGLDRDDYQMGDRLLTASTLHNPDPDAKSRMMNLVEQTRSISDYIEELVRTEFSDSLSIAIGGVIAGSVDDSGYLRMDTAEIAQACGSSEEQVERVLFAVLHGEHPGIGARSVSECLHAQMEALGLDSEWERTLLFDHIEKLASGNFAALERETGIPRGEIAEFLREIRQLNPRPGLSVCGESTQLVIPEIEIRRSTTDETCLELSFCDPVGLQVHINEEYAELFSRGSFGKGSAKVLSEQLRRARAMVANLERRQQTLLSIASFVMKEQRVFFTSPSGMLRPLKMVDAAQRLDMSSSTVSRLARATYVKSPRGVHQLRFFFTASGVRSVAASDAEISAGVTTADEQVQTSRPQMVSRDYVSVLVGELIGGEDRANPLSDQDISMLLGQRGIEISRRTVSKYRDGLGVPSQKTRKRDYASNPGERGIAIAASAMDIKKRGRR